MFVRTSLLFVVLGLSSAVQADVMQSITSPVGFQAVSYAGRSTLVDFKSYAGRPALLYFWTTQDEFCRAEVPKLLAFAKAHPKILFISVHVHNASADYIIRHATHLFLIAKNGGTIPKNVRTVFVTADAEVISSYDLFTLPTALFISRDNKIVAWRNGTLDWSGPRPAQLASEIEKKN